MDEHINRIYQLALDLLTADPGVKAVMGSDYMLEPGAEVVFNTATVEHPIEGKIKLSATTDFGRSATPPFEWKLEITYPIDPDYPRHYLLLKDGRFIRAVRKDFFPVDETEMANIERELGEIFAAR